jgi:hypothetical protein
MEFFVFDPPMMVGPWAFADVVDPIYGKAPRCKVCGQLIGMRPWLPPRKAKLSAGTKTREPADAVTGPGFTGFMASRRFVTAFERAALRGIDSWEPVDLEGFSPDAYSFGVMPVPTVIARLSEMGALFDGEPPSCPRCQQAVLTSYSGVVVNDESWAGQDFFQLTNPSILLASERFADLVAMGKFTGFDLVPAAEYRPSYASRKTG